MQIIIVDRKQGQTRSLVLQGWVCVALTICLFGLPLLLGYFGYQFSSIRGLDLDSDKTVQAWIGSLQDLRLAHDSVVSPAAASRTDPRFPDWPGMLSQARALLNQDCVRMLPQYAQRAAAAALFGLHKHGRVLDPASYLHRTIR